MWSKIRKLIIQSTITKKNKTTNPLSIGSVRHRERLREGKTDRMTWHCYKDILVHTEDEQITSVVYLRPFLSSTFNFRVKHFYSNHPKRGFWYKRKFQRTNGTAPESQICLNLLPECLWRGRRGLCAVFFLCTSFSSPVTTPDCTCAWFHLLANFPTLARGFMSLHLKVSPEPRQAHFLNQSIMAGSHTHHSKLQGFWKRVQTSWGQKHL